MDMADADILDPNPDIHALFCYYNTVYFSDALGSCLVTWSSKRMTLCAGICCYQVGGGCEIRLSEPLLKFRSSADLKNTLLHEMIHAYLWIKNNNKDHSDHGPNFQKLMKEINCSSVIDHQRPVGGYNITVYHSFHDEVDSYRVHHWACQSCGDLIKRAMNREPSASDCIEKVRHNGFCGNASCHWHQHKMLCAGSYKKIAEPPGYEDEKRGSKGKHVAHQGTGTAKESTGAPRQSARRTRKAVGGKDQMDRQQTNTIENFYPSISDVNRNSSSPCPSGDDSESSLNCDESRAIEDKTRTLKLGRTCTSRKKRKSTHVKCDELGRRVNDYTVIIEWKRWYVNEEEEDKDIEPLNNKRTENRRRQKLQNNLTGVALEVEDMDEASESIKGKSVATGHGSGKRKSSSLVIDDDM